MPGALVEYARFVEVQQRRSRIIAELERTAETRASEAAPAAADQFIDHGETVAPVDKDTTCGTVDGR